MMMMMMGIVGMGRTWMGVGCEEIVLGVYRWHWEGGDGVEGVEMALGHCALRCVNFETK